MTYKYKQFHCRMRYATLLKLRRALPSTKGESMASYFERLAKRLNDLGLEFTYGR